MKPSVIAGGGSRKAERWCGSVGLAVLVLFALGTAPSGEAAGSDPPDALAKLGGFVGRWETERVEFFDETGRVTEISSAAACNELALQGFVMVHQGRLEHPAIETRGWYYWRQDDRRLHLASVTDSGRYDEFVGGWDGDRLVMVTLPNPAYDGRLFRMIHDEITETSYRERLEVSADGGETWRVSSRQLMRRVSGGAS